MKKVLAIALMMFMLLGITVPAFAAPGAFLKSPSENPAPEIIEFEPIGGEECDAELVITPYSDRKTLPESLRALIESVYKVIVNSEDLTTLNNDLADKAAEKEIDGKFLKVSDLFDLSLIGCTEHNHTGYKVVVKASTLKNFVGLLHVNESGEFELIDNAKVVDRGESLEFVVTGFSPYAIVVDTTDDPNPPATGDINMIHVYAIVMSVSALGVIAIAVFAKKRKI